MTKTKLKVIEVSKSINLMHHVDVDMGMFKVEATSHTFLYPAKETDWGADINDTELIFFINDKRCKYVGFRDLYNQLHGDGSFKVFEANTIARVEDVVAKEIIKEYPGTKVIY